VHFLTRVLFDIPTLIISKTFSIATTTIYVWFILSWIELSIFFAIRKPLNYLQALISGYLMIPLL
jgi:hypothetical protein